MRSPSTQGERSRFDGFCVSGFVLSALSFVGSFYSYIASNVRHDAEHAAIHWWYRLLFPGSPILMALGVALSIVGLAAVRREPGRRGAALAMLGLLVGAAALLHWGIRFLFYWYLSGFA